MHNGALHLNPNLNPDINTDPDPQETAEWLDAFEALAATHGPARARQLLDALSRSARARRSSMESPAPNSASSAQTRFKSSST